MTKRVDPKWQEVQEETLVNWANATLRGPVSGDGDVLQIENLKEDIKDGKVLMELLDSVSSSLGSGLKVKKRYKKPRLEVQMRENIAECFKFIEQENIKLVNIGVVDVMEGNVKLMLGLIWTLIRRYQIKSSGKAISTKQALLQLLETLIPEKNITNFSTCWNDGTALCTLVDRIKPGTCSNHSMLNPEEGLKNCTFGMTLAKEELDIPQILKPEHLNNPRVDEMSVMTYISYFCKPLMNDLLAWVQSKIPHQNITNFNRDWNTGVNLAALLESISPGLFPEWNQLDPHDAIANLEKAMAAAEQLGAKRVIEPEDFAAPDVDEINIVTYLSRIQKCKPVALPQKCTVTGQGIVRAFVGREAYFEVNATHGGIGELQVTAQHSSGDKIAFNIKELHKDVFNVSYIVKRSGSLTINVTWGGKELGPFKPSLVDPGTFNFYGPEITEGKLCRVGKPVSMIAEGIPDIKELDVLINDKEPVAIEPKGSHEAVCTYTPRRSGTQQIIVKLSGKEVPQSPFEIKVVDPSLCKIVAKDEDPICIGKPFTLKLSTNGVNEHSITAKATSPTQTISLMADSQSEDGLVIFRYTPKELGSHSINITCADEDIQGCPVSIEVIDVMKVVLKESIPKYVIIGKPITIDFDTTNAGDDIFTANTSDPNVLTSVVEEKTNLQSVQLNPLSLGECELTVTYGGYPLYGFPAKINICDPSACIASGKGLSSKQGKVEELFEFTVQAANAGNGELEVISSGPNGKYAADIKKKGNGKYKVSFTSYEAGLHSIQILWCGHPIPDSPIAVKFVNTPSGQFSANGDGLFKCTAKQTAQFMLLGRDSGLLEDQILQVTIEGNAMSSKLVPTLGPVSMDPNILVCMEELGNGKYQVRYAVPECGDYDIFITCSDEQITGSPFSVYALPAPEADKCHVFGPAIDEPNDLVVGKPIEFKVDSTSAGTGMLEVKAFDPTMTALPVFLGEQRGAMNERIHIIKIDPNSPGKHTFEVKWSNDHIPDSPLRFEVGDPKMVKIVSIPDTDSYIPKIGEAFDIIMDDTNAGPGVLAAKIKLPNNTIQALPVEINKHKLKKFTFNPKEVGRIELLLTYSGVNLLEFPWISNVVNAKSFEVVSTLTYVQLGDYVKFVVGGMKKSNAKNMVLKARNEACDHDATVKVDMKKDGTAIARFTAKHIGSYDVSIMCANQHVSGSPFTIFVVNPDNAKFRKKLPSTLVLGLKYRIEIDGSKCGPGELQYAITQKTEPPNSIDCTLESAEDDYYKILVHPVAIGECELGFQWEDFQINEMQKISVIDLKKFKFSFPQLKDKKTFKQNNLITLEMDVSECGNCIPEVIAKGPQATYNVKVKGKSNGRFVAKFSPWQTGDHSITLTINGIKVTNSPIKFLVIKDIDPQQIIASGDGLREALTDQKNIVKIHGLESGMLERGQLTFNLYSLIGEYSTQPESECVDNGSGVYTLTYIPREDGDHCLDIMYEGKHISSSPFKIFVKYQARADKCITSGRIIQPYSYLSIREQAEIIVNSRDAGTGVLKASGKQPDGSPIRVFVNYEGKDKLHYLRFDASKVGAHTINVKWNDTPITGSPFTVNVIDPSRCIITGDIPTYLQKGKSKMITVDTTGAGHCALDVLLNGNSKSSIVACTVKERSASQYEIQFDACEVGQVEVSVQWGGYHIAKSPFVMEVCDANKCILKAQNVRGKLLPANCPFTFILQTTGAGNGKPAIRPSWGSEAQYIIDISSNDEGDEHTITCTPHNIGEQQLDVFWAESEIEQSPLSFSVFAPNNCAITGLPDSSTFIPVIGEDIVFSIDQSECGPGTLEVIARLSDGTEEVVPQENVDSVTTFTYSPHMLGKLELLVKFNGLDALKTPWISDVPDPLQFRVTQPKATGKVYEPVKFFITGITEQKQDLIKVNAVHPDHPATVSVELGKEGNTAVATFTPEAVGEYLVNVKHAFKDIDGSPFVVDVVNPNIIDIVDPPFEQVAVDEEYIVRLKTLGAGNGPLTCHFTSLTGDVSLTSTIVAVEDSPNDMVEVHFIVNGVGSGQITLRWGDHIISPSPYDVHIIDPSKVHITCPALGDNQPLNLGEPTEIVINCCEAGNGVPNVTVNNQSTEVNSTAINHQDRKDGTYLVTITPWKSGDHELLVKFGDYPVPETPISFEVQKIIDPRAIVAVGEGLSSAIVNEPNVMVITASVANLVNDGLLKASCVHINKNAEESDIDVEIDFQDKNDGSYELTVVYPQIGDYVLHIDYKEQPIYDSPFNISVKAPPSAENCKIFGTAIEKMQNGNAFLVSQSIQFMIDTTLAGNGYLMCTVQDPSGDPVRVFSNDEETDGQKISYLQFDPYEVGNYTVQVFWSSESIPGTPLIFNIVDPTRCLAQGLPIPNNGAVQVGENIEFAIAPGNCGIEKPHVTISVKEKEEHTDIVPEITETGVYKYKHSIEEPGKFNINITIGKCHIPGSPFRCEVLDPNQFAIFGLNLEESKYAIVCEMVSFKIQGQPPEGEPFIVTAHGPLADLSCDLKPISNNLTLSSFVPIEPGAYEVFVEYANKHVRGSPFTVNVADPSKCQVLEVPSQIQIDKTHELIIKTRGAGAGGLEATLMNQTEGETNVIDLTIEDQGLDTYSVQLLPHKVSDVQLQITWAGYPIPQSPFHLSVCDAKQCKVYGQAILSKKGKVGEAISFTVVSNRAGNCKPVIKASGPSAQYNITSKEIDQHKHEAQFTPWEIGDHTVEILWGDEKIPNSPFVINVEKNFSGLPTCHATGEGLKKAISGKQAMFTLVSNEVGLLEKEALKVSVAGVRGHAEVELADLTDGRYQVKYLPSNPGAYIATVTYYDRPIPGSPFKISCVPGPDASKCRVEGLHPNSLFLTGNPIEFTVNSSEAGYGQLKVFIQGPKDYNPKVYVADDGKGLHFVKFDAMKQGRYSIVVAWSESHIPGSPFRIKVHPAPDASKVKTEGPGLSNGSLNGDTNFSIDTKEAGVGTLLIRVHGIKDTFRIEANPLKPDDPRILIANYNPTRRGDYTIFIRWSGNHVPGSPFTVHLSGKEKNTELGIDARKMIRGAEHGESTDGAIRHSSHRSSTNEVSAESGGHKHRSISRSKVIIRHTDESRRISREEAAEAMTRQSHHRTRKRSFLSLFRSPMRGVTRSRSGSELPRGAVGPVKPSLKLKKNPSMGQMPMYMPKTVAPIDQPLLMDKQEARRGKRKEKRKKSKSSSPQPQDDSDLIIAETEETDAPAHVLEKHEKVKEKPKKSRKKSKGFELN